MAFDLEGNWKKGKAFDLHTVSSAHLGVDEYGHDQFDSIRSEMGQLVFELKYRGNDRALPRVVQLLDAIKGIETFDFIVPIPPTKKNRAYQPVELIAKALGERRGVKVLTKLLVNKGNEELKGISDPIERLDRLKEALRIDEKTDIAGAKVLLVDGLYRSGSTLRIATDLLYTECKAGTVSVLTMTKTRSAR
jgi:competence protein ComFC